MDANDAYEYSDELNEGRRHIRGGCTIGRIINLCITLDFLLVLITALIVSGCLGAVNLTLQQSYPDHPNEPTPIKHEVCILYSSCTNPNSPNNALCNFHYNTSGVCKFVEVAFGFIGLVALIYMVISIVRAILTTNIWFTVFIDLVVILFSVVVAFSAGVTISIGFSVTCASVFARYGFGSCDQRIPFLRTAADPATPGPNGAYAFFHPVNVAQSCAWLCFAFLAVLFIITIVRIIIFIKRRRGSGGENIDDITDVLSNEHIDDEEEDAKPI